MPAIHTLCTLCALNRTAALPLQDGEVTAQLDFFFFLNKHLRLAICMV